MLLAVSLLATRLLGLAPELVHQIATVVTPHPRPGSPSPSAGLPQPFKVDTGGTSITDWIAAGSAVLTFITVIVALLTYRHTKEEAQRQRRATVFAESLQAIEEYMETPYRIRRRPHRDAQARWELTESISAIKARISFHQAWLQTEGLPEAAVAFEALVRAALAEAGPEMTRGWSEPGVKQDEEVPLGQPYTRDAVDRAREAFLHAAATALHGR